MAEYDSLIRDTFAGQADNAAQIVVGNSDEDPQKAVRAIELGQAFGTNPSVVYGDLDNFEAQAKANLAATVVRGNPHLQTYVNSNPMAAKVSGDDYGQMDAASAAIQKSQGDSILGAAWKGFKANFDAQGLSQENQQLADYLAKSPAFGNIFIRHATLAGATALEGGMRFFSGLIGGAAAGVGQAYVSSGGNEAQGARLTRDLIQMAQVAAPEMVHGIGTEAAPITASADRALAPYIADGKVPPPGVHPVIDELHKAQADLDKTNLSEALKESVASATRERAPDLYRDFVAQHTGDTHIGISADAVRELYGDKLPEPDDGLLGWVPRIQEQLETAATTGADVQVPLADYLAKVEPEVHKALEDHIRVRPEGMTPEEAKEAIPTQVQDTVEAGLRQATGIKDAQPTPESIEKAKQLDLALPDTTPLDQREEFAKANAIGMTVDQYRRYQKLIEQRAAEDAEAASARALAEERKRQTEEWKANRVALRPQVVDEVASRPGHELDEMLREGRVKLSTDYLTPEDKAVLPKEFYAKDGIHPDDLAGLFGLGSGREAVDQLRQVVEQRTASGMKPEEFRRRVIDAETDRQMEIKYGNLDKNIIEEVKDQVLSETQQQLLHEETLALASQAGLEFSLTKEGLEGAIRQAFDKTLVRQVDSDRFMADAGKAGRAAEMALLKGDAAEAFRQKQRQYHAFVGARLAKQFEKVQASFEKTAKRFSAREVSSVDQEYTNWIHDILLRTGHGVKRSIQDLQESLARGEQKTLEEFVAYKEGHDLREVPVADFLQDPAFRKASAEDLSVAEYRALADSVKTLAKNGRDERKITRAGEEADLADVRAQMIEQLATFKEKHYDASGGRPLGPLPARVGHALRTYVAAHLQLETIFRRWDRGDPRGVFTQYVSRELASAANTEQALVREYAQKLKALKDGVDLKERIPNPIFRDPLTIETPVGEGPAKGALMPMTRENLRAVLLNVGNPSNLEKLAKGYRLAPEVIHEWLNTHATKEDWDFAQGLGNLFAEIKAKSDVMYRNLSGGIEPENIPVQPIVTKHGTYPGWYYPIVYDPIREGASKKLMGKDPLEGENYVRATVPAGYTKQRTGYIAPLALHMDMIPIRIQGMLHDLAMRPAVIQASKIFYDRDIRNAITKHYGSEYKDLLVPYLQDVANSANARSNVQAVGNRVLEMARQNLISTLVGFNPGTVAKHGPTALVNSVSEVGAKEFLKATVGLLSKDEVTGESNWQFAMKNSEELQRRHRNWTETLGGAQSELVPRGAFGSLRQTLIQAGATPVAVSDLLSAVPTWLAKYTSEMDDHGIHGDAVYEADRAVRRAHGSTVVTNRPEIMRRGNPWFTSLYGFFNHIMNRQVEMVWHASDTLKMASEGDIKGALAETPKLTSQLFSYVIFPALVEEYVTGLPDDKHRGLLTKAAMGLAFTLSSSWVFARDIASAALAGRDPTGGLTGTFGKTITDTYRDLHKSRPFSKQHLGNIVQHGATAIGAVTGMATAQEGRTAKFIYNYATGQEHPRTLPQWYRGLRYGTTKER